jgi:hypothetical protein
VVNAYDAATEALKRERQSFELPAGYSVRPIHHGSTFAQILVGSAAQRGAPSSLRRGVRWWLEWSCCFIFGYSIATRAILGKLALALEYAKFATEKAALENDTLRVAVRLGASSRSRACVPICIRVLVHTAAPARVAECQRTHTAGL